MDVRYERVSKRFGDVAALNELDLHVNDGDFMVMLGPSGCGKTTGLRIVAGLEEATSGRVLLGDRDVTRTPARERDVAMVFQSYALYPHMSVRDNIAYPLRVRRTPKPDREERARSVAERLMIEPLLDRKPRELSGGQRQRVALARAIIRQPSVFLMDEPLSNLDAKLRIQMRVELKRLQKDLGVTTIYVTHDQSEATTMADCVAVMSNGRLEQLGSPREIYDFPANETVASFVGSPQMNIADVETGDSGLRIGDAFCAVGHALLARVRQAAKGAPLRIGVRPEDIVATAAGQGAAAGAARGDTANGADPGFAAEVYVVQPMDNETLVTFQSGQTQLTGRFPCDFEPAVGSRFHLRLREDKLHFFHRESGVCILSTRRGADRAGVAPEPAPGVQPKVAERA
jgi:multiple sugar transport system ATP-binding protein